MKPLPNPVDYHIYTGQSLPAPNLYAYALAGQGVIKLAETPHFSAAIPLAGVVPQGEAKRSGPQRGQGDVTGLPDYPIGIDLRVSRIPATWLRSVLDHARRQSSGQGVLRPIEQMYHFHYFETGWRVSIPKQQASAAHAFYHGGHESSVVLDLHSHHEMRAFFSSTDDADEQGLRFYGVIGRIYTRPEIRLRVGIYGDWLELPASFLFDGLGPFAETELVAGEWEIQNDETN